MAKHTTEADLDLLNELGVDLESAPILQRSPKEERIIAGFEEIERFFKEQGRLPQHGADRDIFERIYAVRLDKLRASEECRALLKILDSHGLLDRTTETNIATETEDLSDEALLDSLGVLPELENELTQLTHVRSPQEIKTAEEIAKRTPCKDFKQFKPLFKQVQQELKLGIRQTLKYQDNAAINQGDFFILNGQKALIVDMDEVFISNYGLPNRRLRVIFDNGTESNTLLRSFQRTLNKDETSRRITRNPEDLGPLFAEGNFQEDVSTGYIYVLRSKSDEPFIAKHRDVIHKIGVTGGDVRKRIANAKKDPTYLLADVEIVATFQLTNLDGKKLEALLHKFFDATRLEVELEDRFGISVKAKEWFLVPLEVIEQTIEKIETGTLDQFRYDPQVARLVRLKEVMS